MKKFKILLSFLLIFSVFAFASCSTVKNPNSNTENGQTDTETEKKLTASDVLQLSYEKLEYAFVTKTTSSRNFSNGDAKTQYDTFVSQALSLLKKSTEISDFKFNNVYTGKSLELAEDSTSNLNKVRYLSATSKETENIFEITLSIVLSKTNFETNPLNFMLAKLVLDYNTKTNELECTCDIENSFSNATFDVEHADDTISRADYYHFHFDSKWNRYDGAYFHRASTKAKNFSSLDYASVYTIKNFNIISFNFLTMQNDMMSNYTTIEQNQESIQSIILKFEEFNSTYLALDMAETETEQLSETLIPIFESIPELG